ncbi:hypothetical protein Mhar_0210 [Methanothrix harundinacea 6Ac]|uniref:Uncharacterized protein n=2 Tax=Methanothrix harundinacea TaxID=301375 RepID=G7WL47_METH6|nr:hypothetical protein Mhar_0210 [Methanothrix harundinacea 6Ac]
MLLKFYCDYMRRNLWIGAAAVLMLLSLPAAFAQSCDWTGTWETNWGEMELQQHGNNTVTGTYTHDNGRISGTILGDVLIGTWSEDAQEDPYMPPYNAGEVEFTISDDCSSFDGRWRYGSSGEWGSWSGTRIMER